MMDDMTAFERQLAAELGDMAGPGRRIDGMDMVRTVAGASFGWRLQATFGATRVVAAAFVALVGGFLLAGGLTSQHDDAAPVGSAPNGSAATPVPIELPAVIPGDVVSDVFETPMGQVRWVHLSGGASTLPRSIHGLISTPDGYLVAEPDGIEGYSSRPRPSEARLWRSTDLVSWISEPLEFEATWVTPSRADDVYWLSASGPTSLWHSMDLDVWERVSLAGLTPPEPAGFAWDLQLGSPVSHGDATIVPFMWSGDGGVLARALDIDDDIERYPILVETEPGVYDVGDYRGGWSDLDVEQRETLATVRFEQTGADLRILDAEDGTELGRLEGVSMAFIERLTSEDVQRGDYIVPPVSALGVVDDGALIDVALPHGVGHQLKQAFTADERGFVSFTVEDDGLIHVHQSPDGRDWSESDLIGDDPDEPTGFEAVWIGRDGVTARTGTGAEWTLGAGVPERVLHPGGGDAWLMPGGSIRGPFSGDVRQVRLAPEGGGMIDIDLPATFPTRACGGSEGLLSPNTFASVPDCEGMETRHVLIVTVDDTENGERPAG